MAYSWEDLFLELLEQILKKLSYPDAVRFSVVCTSWREAAKSSRVLSLPILVTIPPEQPGLSLNLQSHVDGKLSCLVHELAVSHDTRYSDAYNIGFSNGLLIFRFKCPETDIALVDPFSRESFRLPPLLRSANQDLVNKVAVLVLSEEKKRNNNLVLVVNYPTSLRYCRVGSGSWVTLDEGRHYMDIVARERRLFVLINPGVVEAWDFDPNGSDLPTKVFKFVPSEPIVSKYTHLHERPKLFEHQFLVESAGEFLLVKMVYGLQYWNRRCLTTIKTFELYKCRLGDGEKWEEVESLGDERALFLGRNDSILLSSRDLLKDRSGNSIYFTNLYSGTGIFSFESKKVVPINGDHQVGSQSYWILNKDIP